MMEDGNAGGYGTAPSTGAPGTGQTDQSSLMTSAVAGAAVDVFKAEGEKLKKLAIQIRDGPISVRILSYIGGIMLVVMGFFSFFGNFITLNAVGALVQVYLFFFGWVIVFLEGRNSVLPTSVVKNIHKYALFLSLIWGRGCFFFFCGTLSLSQWNFMNALLGIYLCTLGAVMIYYGHNAMKKMEVIKGMLKDKTAVLAKFTEFDANHNGALEVKELGNLTAAMGIEMSQGECETAILMLDKNRNGTIEYAEFEAWWSGQELTDVV
ncbi:unnamed protein product [Discosporangium mesarthrocarpum]